MSNSSEVLTVNITWFMANDDGVFNNISTYDYSYYNITKNFLYTTSVGNGSVSTPIQNYTNWFCNINVYNGVTFLVQNSSIIKIKQNLRMNYFKVLILRKKREKLAI